MPPAPACEPLAVILRQQKTVTRQLYILLTFLLVVSIKGKAQVETVKVNDTHKITFDLKDRQVIFYPPNPSDTDKKGIVVVEIIVDSNGDVIKAKPGIAGTTTTSAILLAKARQAALKTKFSKKLDTKEQLGTLTVAIDLKH